MIKFAKHLLSFYNGECINKRTIIKIRLYTHIHSNLHTHTHIHKYLYYIYIIYQNESMRAEAPHIVYKSF